MPLQITSVDGSHASLTLNGVRTNVIGVKQRIERRLKLSHGQQRLFAMNQPDGDELTDDVDVRPYSACSLILVKKAAVVQVDPPAGNVAPADTVPAAADPAIAGLAPLQLAELQALLPHVNRPTLYRLEAQFHGIPVAQLDRDSIREQEAHSGYRTLSEATS
jgi:hypothetical protein